MKFLDETRIFVRSGNGGAGAVSFRREKFIEYGGPDGGDGGRGGSVICECVQGLNTLIDYRFQQHFKAQTGVHGMGKNRHGANGEDVVLKVPVGTEVLIEHEDGELTPIADMVEIGQRIVIAKGGNGGFGNAYFKSSTNRAPRKANPGLEGVELTLILQLKLIADVGLIGLPNAGKSTLLASTTRAKPKIADYPFTTLYPGLGVCAIDGKEFVMADIPGLIEGAHEGHGLGDRFLKHVERCAVLVHLVDVNSDDPVRDYKTIRKELKAYGGELHQKREIVALSKIDSIDEDTLQEKAALFYKKTKKKPYLISAVAGVGVQDVLRSAFKTVLKFRSETETPEAHQTIEETQVWSPI